MLVRLIIYPQHLFSTYPKNYLESSEDITDYTKNDTKRFITKYKKIHYKIQRKCKCK